MWTAQYAAYKAATDQMGPATVSTWTFLIAALILLPFLLWERRSAMFGRPFGLPNGGSIRGRLAGFAMIAALGLIPSSALLAWGTALSTASSAALLYLTIPIITALMATAMLKERMTPIRWVSLFVSLVGVLVIFDLDWRQMGVRNSSLLLGKWPGPAGLRQQRLLQRVLEETAAAVHAARSPDLWLRDGRDCQRAAVDLGGAALSGGGEEVHGSYLDLAAGAQRGKLGPGDGAVDVSAPAFRREPDIGLRVLAAIPRRTHLRGHVAREDHREHGGRRLDHRGRNRPDHIHRAFRFLGIPA